MIRRRGTSIKVSILIVWLLVCSCWFYRMARLGRTEAMHETCAPKAAATY
jgi:hypothetical protein